MLEETPMHVGHLVNGLTQKLQLHTSGLLTDKQLIFFGRLVHGV